MKMETMQEVDNLENKFIRTAIRHEKFVKDAERVARVEESIVKCQSILAEKRRQRAMERAEYKKALAFFHKNRRSISVEEFGDLYFAIWKSPRGEYKVAMCKKNRNDTWNWKFMKSLFAKRLQDSNKHICIKKNEVHPILFQLIKANWEKWGE
jgi:hypothetical protein